MTFRKRSAPMTGDLEADIRRVECRECGHWSLPEELKCRECGHWFDEVPPSMRKLEEQMATQAKMLCGPRPTLERPDPVTMRDLAVRRVTDLWSIRKTDHYSTPIGISMAAALDELLHWQEARDDELLREDADAD